MGNIPKISPLPAPPTTEDIENFDERSDEFLPAVVDAAAEMNVMADWMSGTAQAVSDDKDSTSQSQQAAQQSASASQQSADESEQHRLKAELAAALAEAAAGLEPETGEGAQQLISRYAYPVGALAQFCGKDYAQGEWHQALGLIYKKDVYPELFEAIGHKFIWNDSESDNSLIALRDNLITETVTCVDEQGEVIEGITRAFSTGTVFSECGNYIFTPCIATTTNELVLYVFSTDIVDGELRRVASITLQSPHGGYPYIWSLPSESFSKKEGDIHLVYSTAHYRYLMSHNGRTTYAHMMYKTSFNEITGVTTRTSTSLRSPSTEVLDSLTLTSNYEKDAFIATYIESSSARSHLVNSNLVKSQLPLSSAYPVFLNRGFCLVGNTILRVNEDATEAESTGRETLLLSKSGTSTFYDTGFTETGEFVANIKGRFYSYAADYDGNETISELAQFADAPDLDLQSGMLKVENVVGGGIRVNGVYFYNKTIRRFFAMKGAVKEGSQLNPKRFTNPVRIARVSAASDFSTTGKATIYRLDLDFETEFRCPDSVPAQIKVRN